MRRGHVYGLRNRRQSAAREAASGITTSVESTSQGLSRVPVAADDLIDGLYREFKPERS
jgi:hypothetical protein